MTSRPDRAQPPPADVVALARCRLLSGLSADELARLLSWAEHVEVTAGAAFLREGDETQDMYFVLAGEARLDRHQLALKTLGEGDHFGALGLLTGRPRTTSVTAVTALTLARISPRSWAEFAVREPHLGLRIVQALLGQVRDDLVEMTDSVGALLQGRSLPRSREVAVQVGGARRTVPTGTPIRALLPAEVGGALVVAGLLGQKPVSLSTPLFADASVSPLTVSHTEGRQIYTHSVGLLLLEAARRVAPGLVVRLGAARGRSHEVDVEGPADRPALALALDAEMRRLVAADAPLRQEHWMLEEAMALFRERGWDDAAQLLRTRREGTAPLAALGEVYAISPGPLLPSTALAGDFRIEVRDGEIVLDCGPGDDDGDAGPAPEPSRDGGMIEEHRAWLSAMGVVSVGAFNDACISGQVSQLIRVAEGFHEKRIGRVADDVASRRDRLRIIAIAGPSSSGKTTFIKRLTVQMQINGQNPVGLSLDDYYVDRDRTVRGADGAYDYEALEALDLPLLQGHVRRLLAGEEVVTAHYDFRTGKSERGGGPRIRLRPGDVLMLEGIHGLNPRLLGPIPGEGQLYRVFIHPATTLPFDRLTRVSATDLRLLAADRSRPPRARLQRRGEHRALARGAPGGGGAHLPLPGRIGRGVRLLPHLRARGPEGLRGALPARGVAAARGLPDRHQAPPPPRPLRPHPPRPRATHLDHPGVRGRQRLRVLRRGGLAAPARIERLPAAGRAGSGRSRARGSRLSVPEEVRGREEEHVGHGRRTGEDHEQPVEPQGDPARVRHAANGLEETLVERVGGPPHPHAQRPLLDEPAALLGSVVQLGEAVRELEPGGVELEALGPARVLGGDPRQRRHRGRPVDEVDRPPPAEAGLDRLEEDAEEGVVEPLAVGAGVDPAAARRGAQPAGVALAGREVHAGAGEGFGDREPIRRAGRDRGRRRASAPAARRPGRTRRHRPRRAPPGPP